MSSRVECYVVRVHPDHNGKNHASFIRDALLEADIDFISVTPIDPSSLPDNLSRTPNHEAFKGAFERIANDPDNPYHLVVHALQVGNGRVNRSTLIECGIPEETIDMTLHALGGHIGNDPKDPEDLDRLYCRLLCTEEPSEEVVFKA